MNARTLALEEFGGSSVPYYAILSHTWETEEVSFRDMQDPLVAKRKRGFVKIQHMLAHRPAKMALNMFGLIPAILTKAAVLNFRRPSTPCSSGTATQKIVMSSFPTY